MLEKLLADRFGEAVAGAERVSNPETLARTAARGSVRSFTTDRVPLETLRMLTAIALSTPTKSDLQQRDIVIVQDPALRKDLNALVAGQAWIADAPELLVFCGNNRRQRQLHEYRNHPFVNDHLDAFVNAVGDA
ncbi:MAG: nitroreductase family protein, partial [Pseudomonadota bacterium]